MPKFVDVHTHTTFAAYDDTEAVIKRALYNDIWIINVGTQRDTSKGTVEWAEKYQPSSAEASKGEGGGVYAAIGLHPIHTDKSYHDVKELGGDESAKEFTSRGEIFDYDYYKKLGASKKVVAIGECGLDYYRLGEETKAKQFAAFEAQINLSHDLQKPLMIHCRNAFPDLISKLSVMSHKLLVNAPGIIHFFTGTKEDAEKLMNLGFSFSFGGVTTFTRDYDEILKYVGLDRIVLETDAPYVTPAPHRGKRNEPSYLPFVAEAIGKVLGVSADDVGKKTTENARKIFKI